MGAGAVKRYWVDTSLILRLLTGEPPELAERALQVFAGAEGGGYRLRVHPLVVAEAFYTLVSFYRVPKEEAARALGELLERDGVEVEEAEVCRLALEEAGRGPLSFVDAFLLHRARLGGLATLDRALARRAREVLPQEPS
ncbi:PIN domain-containing protein [Thermus amyloliquefaciens]|uniref:PIN domain-containing protein n=1 Tax=Thermus amyloliquefaciens TaxID=1449080 RepID=UPI0005708A67|nr:PIN domain-containing protein [Thermus amyloliquefaciens]